MGVLSVLVLMAQPAIAHAQGGVAGQVGDWFSSTINVMSKPKIQVKPALTILDTTRKTVTIVVSNPTTDTVEVTLSRSARGIGRLAGTSLRTTGNGQSGAKGGRLFADDTAATRKVDSLVEDSALVEWIQAIPRTVTLIPGESKSIPVTVDIPAHVKPGVYAGWIIVSTPDRSGTSSNPSSKTTPSGDIKVTIRERPTAQTPKGAAPTGAAPSSKPESGPRVIRSATKLEYRVDAPK